MIKRLLFFILLLLSSGELFAQTTQASISGVVTDDQNKPIPGAAVSVRNESTGFTTKTGTNAQGVFTFKEAFTTYFIAAVIGILISTTFNIVLFNVIDPGAKETLNEIMIKYTVGMLQKFGTPASAINETVPKSLSS